MPYFRLVPTPRLPAVSASFARAHRGSRRLRWASTPPRASPSTARACSDRSLASPKKPALRSPSAPSRRRCRPCLSARSVMDLAASAEVAGWRVAKRAGMRVPAPSMVSIGVLAILAEVTWPPPHSRGPLAAPSRARETPFPFSQVFPSPEKLLHKLWSQRPSSDARALGVGACAALACAGTWNSCRTPIEATLAKLRELRAWAMDRAVHRDARLALPDASATTRRDEGWARNTRKRVCRGEAWRPGRAYP